MVCSSNWNHWDSRRHRGLPVLPGCPGNNNDDGDDDNDDDGDGDGDDDDHDHDDDNNDDDDNNNTDGEPPSPQTAAHVSRLPHRPLPPAQPSPSSTATGPAVPGAGGQRSPGDRGAQGATVAAQSERRRARGARVAWTRGVGVARCRRCLGRLKARGVWPWGLSKKPCRKTPQLEIYRMEDLACRQGDHVLMVFLYRVCVCVHVFSQTLHVCHICLHWGGLRGQCRHIWHKWSVWVLFVFVFVCLCLRSCYCFPHGICSMRGHTLTK